MYVSSEHLCRLSEDSKQSEQTYKEGKKGEMYVNSAHICRLSEDSKKKKKVKEEKFASSEHLCRLFTIILFRTLKFASEKVK